VKLQRHGILAGLALTATLALAACGTDNNSTPSANSTTGGASAAAIACATGSLTAQGSTAQGNAINEWVKNYQTACNGAQINYQGTGSGAGQTAFIGGTADFAGSDSALSATDQPKADAHCKTGPAIHLPMAVGPIAVSYKLSGVSNLQLKPATLAKIFSGKITTWNDPAIAADNSGVTLPSTKIIAIHRSDSSGTTDNFTNYLNATAASDWTFGHDKVWKAPGGEAQSKSDGVGAALAKEEGSIGYIEWSFAAVNNLPIAKIYNGAGEWASLTAESAGKTIAGATLKPSSDKDMTMTIDYKTNTAGAYPIVLVTYEIVCSAGNDATKLPLIKGFLGYTASTDGQAAVGKLGYGALPESVRAKVASTVAALS
jgi:phosphate transport system substrate-binding protein